MINGIRTRSSTIRVGMKAVKFSTSRGVPRALIGISATTVQWVAVRGKWRPVTRTVPSPQSRSYWAVKPTFSSDSWLTLSKASWRESGWASPTGVSSQPS